QEAERHDGHGAAGYQVDEHGVGSHFEPSGSFLKCGLVTYGAFRYTGSSTTMLTRSSWPPWGSGARSKCSVTVVRSLYGTPFFRRYPARRFDVTTRRLLPPSVPDVRSHCALDSPCHVPAFALSRFGEAEPEVSKRNRRVW